MQYDSNGNPLATPTPWNSAPTTYKNNPFVVAGSQTQSVPFVAQPIQSLSSGGVKFDTGVSVPSANVQGSGTQTVPRATQNVALGANMTNLATPAPVPTPTNNNSGDGFDMSLYPGWGEAEARADYKATGGPKGSSGTSNPINSLDASGKEIYDPSLPSLDEQANWIFQNLDEQVAGYGDYKTGMKSELDTNAVDQKLAADAAQTTNVTNLSDNATAEVNRSSGTLRDLTDNANNLLQRLVLMYGGGSSAIGASTATMGNINKQRGGILNLRDTALREIDSKKTAIAATYGLQTQAIDKWVDDNVIKIGNQIEQWKGDIANAKTSVRAQLSAQAVQSATNFLSTLALNQQSYKQNLDTWKMQRDADMKDYATKLQLTAQYTPAQYNYNINPNQTTNGNTGIYSTPTSAVNTDYAGSTGGTGSLSSTLDTSTLNGVGNSTKEKILGQSQ